MFWAAAMSEALGPFWLCAPACGVGVSASFIGLPARCASAAAVRLSPPPRPPARALGLLPRPPDPRLAPGDERFEIPIAGRIFETRGERLIGQAGRAVGEIKSEREERKRYSHADHRGLGPGAGAHRAVGRAC